MVRIKLAPLSEGVHEFHFHPDASELDVDGEAFADIDVDVRLDMHQRRIQISLDVSAVATLQCDRTLRPFSQRINGTYAILFAPTEVPVIEDDEDEDFRLLHASEQEIDLTKDVRDTLLLAVPARKIAPEAEEMEIPLEFGRPEESSAIDPRWEALRKLRE